MATKTGINKGVKNSPNKERKGESHFSFSSLYLKRPRITEKATTLSGSNIYTFDVPECSNKILIKQAITELYKVTPLKINITMSPNKTVIVRGRKGIKQGGKKALVYLKKGETIDFV